jgi:uridine kinase
VIGIDGPGGAGKSTLARRLGDELAPATIVAMDDFYRPSAERAAAPEPRPLAADFDWERLLRQVLRPLHDGRARGQRYDWTDDRLAEWHDVPAGGTVIVEGVYALKRELRDSYDYRLWVTASDAVRLERGVARDGEATRLTWLTEWMPAEDAYALIERPVCAVDLVVDSPGRLPHDSARQVICAAPEPCV